MLLESGETLGMNEIIFLIENSPEGGYEAKAIGHSIYTEADTLDELREMLRDAVACHFDEDERPQMIRLHFVQEEVIAV
jgi:hypothetical protein